MDWTTPQFSRRAVNTAGRTLVAPDYEPIVYEQALNVINNWRASPGLPLNTFQTTLRRKSKEIDKNAVVAQRTKRLPAIELKMRLIPNLGLSQMQDIGGCRCVVNSVRSVERLVRLYEHSHIKHELVHSDDYIAAPRDSGYRGFHLVYRYVSDKRPEFNGLKIEMQVRTRLQHAWATTVETVSTFRQQALKSGLGDEQWLRFFALMGSVLAIREKRPLVPGTPTDETELLRELRSYVEDLDVIRCLTSYRLLLDHVPRGIFRSMRYFLLELRPEQGLLRITPYSKQDAELASTEYLASERQARFQFHEEKRDAVLVSVDSMKALRTAYPNYFADTRRFVREVRRAIVS